VLSSFQENSGVIVIGATNLTHLLDKALVRPGRFDKHVQVPLPDVKGRKQVQTHTRSTRKQQINNRIIQQNKQQRRTTTGTFITEDDVLSLMYFCLCTCILSFL
jgi:ATP-dependent Zn protease